MTPTIESFVHALQQQIAVPKADLEKNIRALLNEMVSQMDLVSQQEIERHKSALEQATLRMNALQQHLIQLEQQFNDLKPDKFAQK